MTKTMKPKGQINLWIAIVGAGGMILASAFTGWFSASNRVGMAETKISVVEERENNHFAETQKRLETMDKKLDRLLELKIIK